MHALRYGARIPVVLKYFGQLCVIMAILQAVPLALSLLLGESGAGLRYAVVTLFILLLGFLLVRLPSPKNIQTNEAMVVTALAFFSAALAASWPMMGSDLCFTDAFFEAVSAVTTTGLTVTATVEDKSLVFLFSRAWMQWYGGLGIVAFSLAVMIQPGSAARRLGDMQDYEEDLAGSTGAHALRMFKVYIILTSAGVIALLLLGAGWRGAVLYALSAISTGGFPPDNAGLAGLENHLVQAAVISLSLVGAFSLVGYHKAVRNGLQVLVRDIQLRAFIAAGLLCALLMSGFLWWFDGFHWPRALGHGALNALSAQSTAGFSTLRIAGIDSGAKLVLILSMLIGGCVGSTAGGIKILRLLILMRLLSSMIQKTGLSKQAVAFTRLGGRSLEADETQGALGIILLFAIFVPLSWLPFLAMGHDPLNSLFEVVSAIGTVGLSTGIAGPHLHPFLKGVLGADMLLGRLEILAWLVLLSPGTWAGRRLEE